jgi:hypothetical protein
MTARECLGAIEKQKKKRAILIDFHLNFLLNGWDFIN